MSHPAGPFYEFSRKMMWLFFIAQVYSFDRESKSWSFQICIEVVWRVVSELNYIQETISFKTLKRKPKKKNGNNMVKRKQQTIQNSYSSKSTCRY